MPEENNYFHTSEYLLNLLPRLKETICSLPFYFSSKTAIQGVEACDLFSLNSLLGATIEIQTVKALNQLRNIWDPNEELTRYAFYRSPQSFPDVRLIADTSDLSAPLVGIELKGWYLLAKEKAPTFRYRVTPDACSDYDLLVVIPWYLENVLSGTPNILTPFIINAKDAAIKRNHYWTYERTTASKCNIKHPDNPTPYPKSREMFLDTPEFDKGGNFGRLARVPGLMDEFIRTTLNANLSGIPAMYWIDFFSLFIDNASVDNIGDILQHKIVNKLLTEHSNVTHIDAIVDNFICSLSELINNLLNIDSK